MRTSSGVSFRLRRRCGLYVAAAVLGLGVLLVGIPVRAGDGPTERVRCHCCRVQVKSKAAIQAGKGTEASREQRRKSRSRVEVLASRLDKKQVEDGRMHVVVIVYWISSYSDDPNVAEREVDAWVSLDLQASYNLPRDVRLTVGVQNVTDEAPPLVVGAFADNYDRDTHSLLGRFVYG